MTEKKEKRNLNDLLGDLVKNHDKKAKKDFDWTNGGTIKKLRPVQELYFPLSDHLFDSSNKKRGIVVCAKTGTGKTLLALKSAWDCKKLGKKFAILEPLKALAQEQADLKFNTNFNVLCVSSDFKENKDELMNPSIDGFIFTFEMFFQQLVNRNPFLDNCGLMVLDEAHLFGDDERGWRIELLLMGLEEFYPQMKILLLSATIGNYQQFADHLNCECLFSDIRPFPLKINTHIYPNTPKSSDKFEEFMSQLNKIFQNYLTQYGLAKFPQILVFCTTKPNTRDLSSWFNSQFGEDGLKSAYHNADMKTKHRNEVEDGFRNGKINVVFCTTTLSMGIDMPCDVVLLTGETFFYWLTKEERLVKPAPIVQIMGRAGRGQGKLTDEKYETDLVFSEENTKRLYGEAHLIFQSGNSDYMEYWLNHQLNVKSRVFPTSEKDIHYVTYGDEPNHLDNFILGLIYMGIRDKQKLIQKYKNIFTDPIELTDILFENTYNWLKLHGFVKSDGSLTSLGEKTIKFAIKPQTALHVVSLKATLSQYEGELDFPNLFALLIATPEFCNSIGFNPKDSIDATCVSTAKNFININKLMNIVKSNEYLTENLETYCDQILKSFAMTYHLELTKIGYPSVPSCANDTVKINESAKRIIEASNRICGNKWKYGIDYEKILTGMMMEEPTFNPTILALVDIDDLGQKTAELLIELGINSMEKLSSMSVDETFVKMREIQHKGEVKRIPSVEKLKQFKIDAKIIVEKQH